MNDTRQHILATGRALVAQRGYTGVGLSELLREAGVPKGSFYHFFKSKEAFGCALLDSFVEGYAEELSATLGSPDMDARARLMAYFEGWRARQSGEAYEARCLVVKLSAEVAELSPGMRDVLDRGVSAIIARLAAVIREGADDGSLPAHSDPQMLATTLYQIWLGASLMGALSRDTIPYDGAMTATAALLDNKGHA
ncbi:TetR family transcriptional regulator [Limimaricola soesokkakensis]|uniref:HTH-type transcriptional repressor NemR n=1 Tax=Limimaricola soesokkakensis TaxID=1343159 RepID=A0A1X7A6H7_9RHOB|nr:TetR/AcrR family transcriptional regulator [Limimaricola soesokkakensis]PSK80348.1 TetR family transcriptional regulator [Limimaricola soesokkakensis]SLN71771.1 HTH-type transcriptional repressor NemR [Limimaricola soesokkakensis]